MDMVKPLLRSPDRQQQAVTAIEQQNQQKIREHVSRIRRRLLLGVTFIVFLMALLGAAAYGYFYFFVQLPHMEEEAKVRKALQEAEDEKKSAAEVLQEVRKKEKDLVEKQKELDKGWESLKAKITEGIAAEQQKRLAAEQALTKAQADLKNAEAKHAQAVTELVSKQKEFGGLAAKLKEVNESLAKAKQEAQTERTQRLRFEQAFGKVQKQAELEGEKFKMLCTLFDVPHNVVFYIKRIVLGEPPGSTPDERVKFRLEKAKLFCDFARRLPNGGGRQTLLKVADTAADEAIDCTQKFKLNSAGTAHHIKGLVLLLQGKRDAAIKEYKRAVTLTKDSNERERINASLLNALADSSSSQSQNEKDQQQGNKKSDES